MACWRRRFGPATRDLVSHIGVTGHGVTVARQHIRSLAEFDFASVLLPYNFPMTRNAAYLDDFDELLAICEEREVAVQTIKSITRAPWGDQKPTTSTWYEPLQDQDAIDVAVHWVLGRPGIFLNTVGDISLLPKVVDAAERFDRRPGDHEMAELEQAWGMEPLFV